MSAPLRPQVSLPELRERVSQWFVSAPAGLATGQQTVDLIHDLLAALADLTQGRKEKAMSLEGCKHGPSNFGSDDQPCSQCEAERVFAESATYRLSERLSRLARVGREEDANTSANQMPGMSPICDMGSENEAGEVATDLTQARTQLEVKAAELDQIREWCLAPKAGAALPDYMTDDVVIPVLRKHNEELRAELSSLRTRVSTLEQERDDLRAQLSTVARQREEQVCTTCTYAFPAESDRYYLGTRPCGHPEWKMPLSSCAFVPLLVAGKPFGCDGWKQRSANQAALISPERQP